MLRRQLAERRFSLRCRLPGETLLLETKLLPLVAGGDLKPSGKVGAALGLALALGWGLYVRTARCSNIYKNSAPNFLLRRGLMEGIRLQPAGLCPALPAVRTGQGGTSLGPASRCQRGPAWRAAWGGVPSSALLRPVTARPGLGKGTRLQT